MRCCLGALVLVLVLAASAAVASERMAIEMIDLQQRTAVELVPLVEPLLGPGEAVTGTGMHLILRSTPETLAQVRQLLDRLDTAPVNLLISVRRGSQSAAVERELQLQGRVGDVVVGDGSGTRIIRRATADRNASVQTLRVVEGQTALIRTGESVPQAGLGPIVLLPGGALAVPGIDYRDIERGFVVRPQLGDGDRVRLEIRQFHDRESRAGGGRIEVQEVDTVLSGALGEWIRVAGGSERRDTSGQRILGTRRAGQDAELEIYLRVDRAD